MKLIHLTIALILSFIIELSNDSIIISYKAQTRGFLYELELKNNHLKINKNEITLTKKQFKELKNSLSKINFEKLSSNIVQQDLAVDKAIEGVLTVSFENKKYQFRFNHHNLPKKISNLKNQLESYFN